jgi:hypothetical protein
MVELSHPPRWSLVDNNGLLVNANNLEGERHVALHAHHDKKIRIDGPTG